MVDIKPQIQEAQRTASKVNTKKRTPGHMSHNKLQKTQGKGDLFKEVRGETPKIYITLLFQNHAKVRRERSESLKVKKKHHETRSL